MSDFAHLRRLQPLLVTALVVLAVGDAAAFEPAAFTPNVVDQTSTLSAAQVAALNGHIQTLRDGADVQAAVYLVSTTGSASIEEAAEATFARWQLGEAGRDNGVLLLFALDDRRARIEVGYGLEATVTDLHARRVLDDVILPSFKTGAYFEGLTAGLFALGYVHTRDERFLSPEYGVPLSAEQLTAEAGDGSSSQFDVARGFRYFSVWAALLWVVPALFRMVRAVFNRRSVPKHRRVRYLLHVDGAWFVKLFLTVNPGIFILLSPLFIDPILETLGEIGAKVDVAAALGRWVVWASAVVLVPLVLRSAAYVVGRRKGHAHPIFRVSRKRRMAFLLGVDGGVGWVAKGVLMLGPGFFAAAMPYVTPEPRGMLVLTGSIALIAWFVVTLRTTLLPLASPRAFKRQQARARLFRIQNRVKASRPIFGKLYTYRPPSSSSSSGGSSRSGSSFSSSSGGGRSGGGGASSSW